MRVNFSLSMSDHRVLCVTDVNLHVCISTLVFQWRASLAVESFLYHVCLKTFIYFISYLLSLQNALYSRPAHCSVRVWSAVVTCYISRLALCSCTVIWAADRFCLPDLASSHWVHLLCLDCFVCVRLFSACMLYYCNTVRWAWLDWGLSGWLTTLLQCFDTVGWVIRPVITIGRITYIVLVQTLNHAQSKHACNLERY